MPPTEASAKEITGGLMAAAVRLGGHHVVDLLEVLQTGWGGVAPREVVEVFKTLGMDG